MKMLGQIVLLRVENAQVRHDEISAWFDELRLDRHFLPPRTSPVNSFKKSATGPDTKLSYDAPWAHPSAVATVRWEDDSHDTERIVRRAMRTVRVQGKAGEPVMVAKVTFYKRSRRAVRTGQGGEKMRFQTIDDRLDTAEQPIIKQWLADAHARYERGQDWVDTDALRGVARDYLLQRLMALMVRPAVYFVYRELENEMNRLQTLVTRFGDECMFHPMEVLDQPRHRAMLQQALNNALEKEALALQRELHALRTKSRHIPAASFAPLVTRYEDIMTMAHEYAEAIGGSGDVAALDRLTETVVSIRKSVR